jgi:cellulose biosynthesis protein BcsQ
MWILATYNLKGGVGKTTASVNLSCAAARYSHQVLVWDLDPQGAATYYFRIKPGIKGGARKILSKKNTLDNSIKATNYPRLELVPADFSNRNLDLRLFEMKHSRQRLERALAPVREDYDFIFLDCAPSISITSENIFTVAHVLLIPLIPTFLSIRAYLQLKAYLGRHNEYQVILLPFFSMVDKRKRLHREIFQNFYKEHPEVLRVPIPYASEVEQMGHYRAPVQTFAGNSMAAKSFDLLWYEIQRRLGA